MVCWGASALVPWSCSLMTGSATAQAKVASQTFRPALTMSVEAVYFHESWLFTLAFKAEERAPKAADWLVLL